MTVWMIVKLQRHGQMADHDLIGIVSITLSEGAVVELVFLQRSIDTACNLSLIHI